MKNQKIIIHPIVNLPGHGQNLSIFLAAVIIFFFWLSSDQTSWRRWIYFLPCLVYFIHFINIFLFRCFSSIFYTFFFSEFVIKLATTVCIHVKIERGQEGGREYTKSREVEDNGLCGEWVRKKYKICRIKPEVAIDRCILGWMVFVIVVVSL